MNDETYHQRLRGEKRAAAVQAAMELFLDQGYHRTSLQQIAKRANVSTATLFKRFPTKAVLFEAIVEEFWAVPVACTGAPAPGDAVPVTCSGAPASGDPAAGLRKIGLDYAQRMRQPEMQALFRLIIAEATRFPDLAQTLYDKGFGPYLFRLSAYLEAETSAGILNVSNPLIAAQQFLAVIAGQAVWPELLSSGCGGTEDEVSAVVEEGVAMMLARYGKQARSAAKSS
jgi:AcrR family transcriptional regulator